MATAWAPGVRACSPLRGSSQTTPARSGEKVHGIADARSAYVARAEVEHPYATQQPRHQLVVLQLCRHDADLSNSAARLDQEFQYHLAAQGWVGAQRAVIDREDRAFVGIEDPPDVLDAALSRVCGSFRAGSARSGDGRGRFDSGGFAASERHAAGVARQGFLVHAPTAATLVGRETAVVDCGGCAAAGAADARVSQLAGVYGAAQVGQGVLQCEQTGGSRHFARIRSRFCRASAVLLRCDCGRGGRTRGFDCPCGGRAGRVLGRERGRGNHDRSRCSEHDSGGLDFDRLGLQAHYLRNR